MLRAPALLILSLVVSLAGWPVAQGCVCGQAQPGKATAAHHTCPCCGGQTPCKGGCHCLHSSSDVPERATVIAPAPSQLVFALDAAPALHYVAPEHETWSASVLAVSHSPRAGAALRHGDRSPPLV